MSRIYSFFGADHKCGTTQLSLSLAEKLSYTCPDKRILFVHMENKKGDEYIDFLEETMEKIRPYLEGVLLDSEDILRKSRYSGSLHVIGGADNPAGSRIFHPDSASTFISYMRDSFDLIICDCGAEIENGLALGSLLSADDIFVVFSQSEAALKRYEWMKDVFEKLGLKNISYALNAYSKDNPYDRSYISKRLNLSEKDLYTVSYDPKGFKSEMDNRSIYSWCSKAYLRDLSILSDLVMKKENEKL